MRIESLACFLAVIDYGTFSRASEKMYISQQGLSKVISNLESEIGLRLFDRSKKQPSATRIAKLLEPHARDIINSYHAILDISEQGRRTHLDILPEVSIIAMPLVVKRLFHHLQDELALFGLSKVRLFEKSLSKSVQHLRASIEPALALIDIRSGDIPGFCGAHTDLTYDRLLSIPITVIGKRELLAGFGLDITKEVFRRLPIAYYDAPTLRQIVEDALDSQPGNIVMRITDDARILEAVISGQAVTINDSLFGSFETDRHELLSLELAWIAPITIGFLYRTDADLHDEQKTFIRRFESLVSTLFHQYATK